MTRPRASEILVGLQQRPQGTLDCGEVSLLVRKHLLPRDGGEPFAGKSLRHRSELFQYLNPSAAPVQRQPVGAVDAHDQRQGGHRSADSRRREDGQSRGQRIRHAIPSRPRPNEIRLHDLDTRKQDRIQLEPATDILNGSSEYRLDLGLIQVACAGVEESADLLLRPREYLTPFSRRKRGEAGLLELRLDQRVDAKLRGLWHPEPRRDRYGGQGDTLDLCAELLFGYCERIGRRRGRATADSDDKHERSYGRLQCAA